MRPLLSLIMIVRNEAKSIRAVLEEVRPFVDRFTIVDTGSTDDTMAIAKDAMAGIPGIVISQIPLTRCGRFDYAANRNALMIHDEMMTYYGPTGAVPPAVFQLMLSGDEFVHEGEKLREYLEIHRDSDIDCHFIRLFLEGMSWQARITRTGSAWRYDDFDLGIHEVPVFTGTGEARVSPSPSGYIDHIVQNPIDRLDNIWENHIPLLEEALERNPENARALEFLIQSKEKFLPHDEEADRKQNAADCCDLYLRRFALPFESEEHRQFFIMRYVDTARIGAVHPPAKLFEIIDKICKTGPERPEPYWIRAAIASTIEGKLANEVYEYAKEAAAKAEAVRLRGGLRNSGPLDLSCEWKAHRLAAVAAANLAAKHPENLPLARLHIAAGIAAGGDWPVFKGIVDDGAIEATIAIPAIENEAAAS